MNLQAIAGAVKSAIDEDIGRGDITSFLTVPEDLVAEGRIIAKQPGIVCGIEIAELVFYMTDRRLRFSAELEDGASVKKGRKIASVTGNARSILKAERVALNFLTMLSGISTKTNEFVRKAAPAKILDTRKTLPNLRIFQKYAVRIGGGLNHRHSLSDMILVKDNHISAAGSIANALDKIAQAKTGKKTEVECETLAQVNEALHYKINYIMLDNMPLADMRKAVKLINKKVMIEASGNITEKNIRQVAGTGVDYISMGALTSTVIPLDMSLELFPIQ